VNSREFTRIREKKCEFGSKAYREKTLVCREKLSEVLRHLQIYPIFTHGAMLSNDNFDEESNKKNSIKIDGTSFNFRGNLEPFYI
jgi:hypothetical protein